MREIEETTLVDLMMSQPEIVAWLGTDNRTLEHENDEDPAATGDDL